MPHREEREFSISLHLLAEFADDYEGDLDGYEWHREFVERLRPRLVNALFRILQSEPGWRAVAAPRGRNPDDALDIEVRRSLSEN